MKTVIVGATPNPHRYAFLAAERLKSHNLEFVPVGIKQGDLFGQKILNIRDKPEIADVHTVTMYVGESHFHGNEDYVIDLKPNRIIFNPGSENRLLEEKANIAGIEVVHGCTLVMLGSGQY